MFFELIATFFAAIGTAGLVMLLNRITGGWLPRWATPVAAGLAMLGYAIWSEMTWAERTGASLPEGLVVIEKIEQTYYWKPWTFAKPQITRFIAMDVATRKENPAAPGTYLVNLYLHGRWQPVQLVPQLVDCTAQARADVTDAALADPAGAARWLELGGADPLIQAMCQS